MHHWHLLIRNHLLVGTEQIMLSHLCLEGRTGYGHSCDTAGKLTACLHHTCVWLEDSPGRDELKTEKAPLRAGHGALRNS